MPATTTNGLPYPVGTDRVADGDDAIRLLAEALDPAWTVLALNASYTARAGSLVPSYRVIAGVVFLRGHVQKSSNYAGGDTPFTLPANARPTAAVSVVFAASKSGAGAGAGRMDIATTGVSTVQPEAVVVNWLSLDGMSFSK